MSTSNTFLSKNCLSERQFPSSSEEKGTPRIEVGAPREKNVTPRSKVGALRAKEGTPREEGGTPRSKEVSRSEKKVARRAEVVTWRRKKISAYGKCYRYTKILCPIFVKGLMHYTVKVHRPLLALGLLLVRISVVTSLVIAIFLFKILSTVKAMISLTDKWQRKTKKQYRNYKYSS